MPAAAVTPRCDSADIKFVGLAEQRRVQVQTPILMLQFICDYCGNSKEPGETWINGVAAENVGTQAARREVIIDPSWRRERALLAFAVHFCSLQCRDNYLAGLFSKPPTLLEIQGAKADLATGARVVRAKKVPATKVVRKRTRTSRRTGTR